MPVIDLLFCLHVFGTIYGPAQDGPSINADLPAPVLHSADQLLGRRDDQAHAPIVSSVPHAGPGLDVAMEDPLFCMRAPERLQGEPAPTVGNRNPRRGLPDLVRMTPIDRATE